jgi:hypothetical protein
VVAGQLTTLRSSRRGQFIDVASGSDEFGRAVLAAGGETSSVRGKKIAFTVVVTPVIAGHATSESPRGSPAVRHVVRNGGSLSATRLSNQ